MNFLIMCIGNREGGDDAIGPYIADKLKDSDINVIDCGTVPENYTGIVKKYNPDKLVIIDAADIGLKSGEFRIYLDYLVNLKWLLFDVRLILHTKHLLH